MIECVHFDSIEVYLLHAWFCLTIKLTISCAPYDVNVFFIFVFFFFSFRLVVVLLYLTLSHTYYFFFFWIGCQTRDTLLRLLYKTKIFKCQLIETVSFFRIIMNMCTKWKIKGFSFFYLFILMYFWVFCIFILLVDHKIVSPCVVSIVVFDCWLKYKTLK